MNTMTNRGLRLGIALLAATFLAGACTSEESVGSGVEVGGGSGQGALRDQGTTTTVVSDGGSDAPTTAPAQDTSGGDTSAGIGRTDDTQPDVSEDTTPVTEAPAPVTTAPRQETIIKITDAGTSFEPLVAQATPGGKVTWQNTGTQPRQVADRENKYFVSPMLQPGESFSWTATAPSGTTINYRDTTRPYAQAAKLEIA